MDRSDRFYKIDQMLNDREVVPLNDFMDELGVSLATFKRDLEYMREHLKAPIEWDRDAGGYRFSKARSPDPAYSLPALWFNASEALALLSMQNLLSGLHGGILSDHIRPLQARLKALLETSEHSAEEVQKRIRIASSNMRMFSPDCFETIAKATLGRKRIVLRHVCRVTEEESDLIVSPQRLTFDCNVWYLDTWCHLRNTIRRFAIDAIRFAELTDEMATEISPELLDEAIESANEASRKAWLFERNHSQFLGIPEGDGVYFVGVP